MNLTDIRSLFAYDRWANEQMLLAAEAVGDEKYRQSVGGSFSSLQGTLSHIVGVEWVWVERFNGESPTAQPEWATNASASDLRGRLGEIEKRQDQFLASVSESELRRVIRYTNLAGEPKEYPLIRLFQHLINHSTYHRGQVVFMLRLLGATPPSTDLLNFAG